MNVNGDNTVSGAINGSTTGIISNAGTLSLTGSFISGSGITLGGVGDGVVAGTTASTSMSVTTFSKTGPGKWTYRGNLSVGTSSVYMSTMNFNGGSLVLDHGSLASNLTNGTATANFNGGILAVTSNTSSATSGSLGSVNLNSGGGQIWLNAGATTPLQWSMGSLTASANGGALLIGTSALATATFNTSAYNGTSGTLLGGTARVVFYDGSNYNWATNAGAGTPVSGLSNLTDLTTNLSLTGGTFTNYSLTNGATTTITGAGGSLNSIKITSTSPGASLALPSTGTVSLSSGGILFAGSNSFDITGGSIRSITGGTAAGSDLIIHQFGTGVLSISATITNGSMASTLTKAGFGTLVLTGSNSYSGGTYLNAGSLEVSSSANLGTGGVLGFYGGTLSIVGSSAFVSNQRIYLGGAGGLINVSNSAGATFSGTVAGINGTTQNGPLMKTGRGTLVLSGTNNSNTGGLYLNEGSLSVGLDVHLGGTGNQLFFNGGTLHESAGFSSSRYITLNKSGEP